MRAEIAEAVAGLLANLDYEHASAGDSKAWLELLTNLSTLVARSRSPVVWDRKGEAIELVGDPEAPGRLVKMLDRLRVGLSLLGLDDDEVAKVLVKVGLDSIPKGRRQVLDAVQSGGRQKAKDVALRCGLPTNTVRRRLDELAAHGIVSRSVGSDGEDGRADHWEVSVWAAALAQKINPEMSSRVHRASVGDEEVKVDGDTYSHDVSGTVSDEPCVTEEF